VLNKRLPQFIQCKGLSSAVTAVGRQEADDRHMTALRDAGKLFNPRGVRWHRQSEGPGGDRLRRARLLEPQQRDTQQGDAGSGPHPSGVNLIAFQN